jgi:mRNA interferase MazF
VIYNRFDVILLRFPFTEKRGQKQRPGIVLTDRDFNEAHQHAITAMVTTGSNTKWLSDVPIVDFIHAGLRVPSLLRMKIFTVAGDLFLGRVGTLSLRDQRTVTEAIRQAMLL